MKIIRFITDKNEQLYGAYNGAEPGRARVIEGDILGRFSLTERNATVKKILPPVNPPNILALGFSYGRHAGETESRAPESPVLFIKGTNSLLGPGETILLPEAGPDEVDFEAELAVVIGKRAKNVTPKEAMEVVLGYTCGNDVTARDLQPKDGQWTVAKSFDTFMPLGPWIETELEPSNLAVSAYLNGEKKQSSNTVNLIFGVPELVEFLSSVMTLEPGDLIMTGTPSGVGPMNSGDEIAVEIQGIGRLVNKVR